MKHQEKSRFQFPCVSKEQIAGFDTNKPATWTASPLVNAILDAIETVRPAKSLHIARHLGIDSREMIAALHILTGMNFLEFIEFWRKARFHRLLEESPEIAPKEMAQRMAFASQGALWTFLTRHKMIEPLGWHWGIPQHMKLRQEVEEEFYDEEESRKEEIRAEVQRRKWEELTKNSK